MADYKFITYNVEQRVATLMLNRPEVLNACHPETHREVQAALAEAELDNEVGVILLCGSGRSFCTGSDLRVNSTLKGDAIRRYLELDYETKNRVATCRKPVVAAMQGHVAGGGFELALACDIRIVAENVQISMIEVSLGTVAGAGGLQRLPQIVGLGIAKEWAMTGRWITAEEAFRTGLANHVYPLEKLMEEATAFSRKLAQNAPLALTLAKVALDPMPPATKGIAGVYHQLASQACHDDPWYANKTGKYSKEK